MSYLIPIASMSLAEQERRRRDAVIAGQQALIDAAVVKDMPGRKNIVDRDPDYGPDFIPVLVRPAAVGFPMSGWMTEPLLLPNGIYNIFAGNNGVAVVPQVPNNQVWVFYGVHVLTLVPAGPVTQLYFAIGTSAIRKAAFDLQKMYDKLETSAYFTQPVVYTPQDIATITVKARIATGVGCEVVLDTIIFEPIQNTQA